MDEKMVVKIGVKPEDEGEDKLRVVTASIWDEDHFNDSRGLFEDMIDKIYDNEIAIKNAVSQIFDDKGIAEDFDLIIFYSP